MVVEDCLTTLKIHELKGHGVFKPNQVITAELTWGSQFTIQCQVSTSDMEKPFIRLTYSSKTENEEGQSVDYCVALATTRPMFGGLRWWFICPLIVNKQPCNRRVGNLYLPSGSTYFGCRRCHELTYASCQKGHRATG
jgi:hypothetical protein